MSVTDVREGEHLGGSFSQGVYSVRVRYHITCAATDGSDTIRRHPNFRIGNGYQFQGESNPELRLESVDPSPRYGINKKTEWAVDCVYSSRQSDPAGGGGDSPSLPDGQENEDSPGLTFSPGFSTRPFYYSRPNTMAKFIKQLRTVAGRPEVDTLRLGGVWDTYTGPVLNSARKPIEPQPETQKAGLTIRQSGGWSRSAAQTYYDAAYPHIGKINAGLVTLSNPARTIRHRAEPYTLKLDSIVVGDHDGGEQFVPVEFEWTWKPDGWFEEFPDKGSSVRYEAVSGAGDVIAEMHADEAIIRDIRGGVVTDDQPLDGRGQLNRDAGFSAYSIVYQLDEEHDFRGMLGQPYTGAW